MTDTPKQKYERTHETLWEGRQKNNRFDGPPKVGNTVTREDADRIQHLCDAFDSEKLDRAEHTEKAMIASGVKEPEDEDDSALTPVKCTCGATNPPGARACANCGIVFTPDARNAQETLDESVKEAYRQTDPDDSETVEEIEAVEEALDDPETVDKLLDNEQVMDKLADKVAERMGGE